MLLNGGFRVHRSDPARVQLYWHVALRPQTYTELVGFAICAKTLGPVYSSRLSPAIAARSTRRALLFDADKEVKPTREHRPLLAGLGRPPALPGSSYCRVRAPS